MASVFLGDLDDFIAPGQACVNPLFVAPVASSAKADADATGSSARGQAPIQLVMEDDAAVGAADSMQVEEAKPDLIRTAGNQTAQVSLDDCLACSGCVTSAETVLITQQSTGKLLDEVRSGRHAIVVASISPQARASLAAQFGLTPLETHARLLTFLRGEGIHHLLDSSLAADFSLLEAGEEFVQKYRAASAGGGPLWTAPPHTVAQSSSTRYNVELGREEDVSGGLAQASVPAPRESDACQASENSLVPGKRMHLGEGAPGAKDEMVSRRRPGDLLVLTSECPGWVCYAEKTVPEALPSMSTVKSPQQIMGALTKRVFPRAWQLPSSTSGADSMEVCNGDAASSPSAPQGVFHVAIAQCYDKKLEASRKDFRHEDLGGQTEVDIVLTTTELMGLIEERAMAHDAVSGGSPSAKLSSGASRAPSEAGLGSSGGAAADVAGAFFRSYPASDITQPLGPGFPVGQASVSADGLSLFGGISGEGSAGGNSGGYLEYVFRYAAYRLFGRDLMGQPLVYREGRNSDFRETSLEIDGKPVLRFAYAYGFRNIQSILARAKRRKCPYHFVEVMACPSGCLNGGGQLKRKKESPREIRERVDAVSEVLRTNRIPRSPRDNLLVEMVYRELIRGEPGGSEARRYLHTMFHNVPKLEVSNPHMSPW